MGKKNQKNFEFSFSIAQEKHAEVFSMPKILQHVFLSPKKQLKKLLIFFMQLPKKIY
jgi:hypothetical protein